MIRVLIVDDDASTLASISRTFRLAATSRSSATTPLGRSRCCKQERFDIVFS
jgi:DNA-binding response OmpR family regulator